MISAFKQKCDFIKQDQVMLLKWKVIDFDEKLFLLKINRGHYAYFPLRHTSFLITQSAYNSILNGEKIILNLLRKKIENKSIISFHFSPDSKNYEPADANLEITTRCNLNCVYCHAESGTESKDMEEDIAYIAIDFALKNAKRLNKSYSVISFHGSGEPTCNFELLKKLVNYAKIHANELGIKVYFAISTNAFFDEQVRNFINENFSCLSISLDGNSKYHNLHRPCISGKGSFETVYRNAKFFYNNKNISLNLRATLSEKSVKELDKIMAFFIENFPEATYSFMPINKIGRGIKCTLNPPDPDEYVDFFKDLMFSEHICPVEQVNLSYGSLSAVREFYCEVFAHPGLNVNVNGLLVKCRRNNLPEDFFFGKISKQNGIKLNPSPANPKKVSRIFTDKSCKLCFARYNCGGECMNLVINNQKRCRSIRRWIAYEIEYLHLNKMNENTNTFDYIRASETENETAPAEFTEGFIIDEQDTGAAQDCLHENEFYSQEVSDWWAYYLNNGENNARD